MSKKKIWLNDKEAKKYLLWTSWAHNQIREGRDWIDCPLKDTYVWN